ncbi:MAG: hypothetical protein EPN26_11960 [Rhodospirillales bacterium]|nr:MAG: hypothetical protein EPN26_11960 [Rhodospirillales bacterium]
MPPRNSSAMTESDRDIYGMWQRSPNYSRVQNLGIRVVDMPAFNSFFAYYLPASFERQSVKRAIVAVHGTGGTAYAEIQDESAMAQKLGYAVIAIQMRLPKDEKRNLPPREMYGLIDQAIRFLKRERKLDISRLAYVGFSVGGAKSFQIAYQDSQSPRPLFSLIVNHSGLSKAETAFLSDIEAGRGPAQPFKGLPFALYCGLRDESWKSQQCDDMARWEQLLVRLGANPIRAIRDEAGGHMGYRKNPDHHEAVMRWFYELTP